MKTWDRAARLAEAALLVVLGHWIMAAPQAEDGELAGRLPAFRQHLTHP